MRKFLSGLPFVLLCLAPADDSAGGGGTPPPSPFAADTAPGLEGETLEAKNTSAAGIISRLFTAGKDLVSRLSTANNDRTRLQDQFDAVTADLTKEKEEHGKTKGELSIAKTTVTNLTGERDTANKNVERLEKLCNLRGIDITAVVPPNNQPENAAGNVWEQYSKLREQERTGAVKPGSAFAFYQKNEKALKEYANSRKTAE